DRVARDDRVAPDDRVTPDKRLRPGRFVDVDEIALEPGFAQENVLRPRERLTAGEAGGWRHSGPQPPRVARAGRIDRPGERDRAGGVPRPRALRELIHAVERGSRVLEDRLECVRTERNTAAIGGAARLDH